MRTLPAQFIEVSDLNEIIFANRNKSYGAYDLRKHYNERLLKAFIITASAALLITLLMTFLLRQKPQTNGDLFVPAEDSIKMFVVEEVKVHQQLQEQSHTDQPPTLIVNDTARETEKKIDTSKQNLSDSHSAFSGDSVFHGGSETGGKGFTADTFEKKSPDIVYEPAPQVPPSFPGGYKAFSRYIQRHFHCNQKSGIASGAERKIILQFAVMNDSSIAHIEVLKSTASAECVNEAVNLLLNSPKWNPGLQNKKPVNVQLVLPITILEE